NALRRNRPVISQVLSPATAHISAPEPSKQVDSMVGGIASSSTVMTPLTVMWMLLSATVFRKLKRRLDSPLVGTPSETCLIKSTIVLSTSGKMGFSIGVSFLLPAGSSAIANGLKKTAGESRNASRRVGVRNLSIGKNATTVSALS